MLINVGDPNGVTLLPTFMVLRAEPGNDPLVELGGRDPVTPFVEVPLLALFAEEFGEVTTLLTAAVTGWILPGLVGSRSLLGV